MPALRPAAALLLAVSLLLLAGGTRGLDVLRTFSGSPGACPFRTRHGVDCLGCGGTRAFGDVARGRLEAGFRRNPVGAMTGVLVWATAAAAAVSFAVRRVRPLLWLLLAAVPLLAGTLAVHAVGWWHTLPPGLDLW